MGDTAGVEPGETIEFGLIFIPDEAREYLDTIRIVSNDRDEGMIELFVRAFGASSVRGEEEVGQAGTPILLSVSPNPFNSMLTIRYEGSPINREATNLRVYDIAGREVTSFVNSQNSSGINTPPSNSQNQSDPDATPYHGVAPAIAGGDWNEAPATAGGDRAATRGGAAADQLFIWDASSQPAGVYFVRLQAGAEIITQKVVLIR